MNLQNNLNNIIPYFIGMNVVPENGEPLMFVNVRFPKTWFVKEDAFVDNNVSITVDNKNGGYYFWGNINAEQYIYNAIESVIKENKDAEKRTALLDEKVTELQNLFNDDSLTLEKLQTLTFNFEPDNTLPPEIKKNVKENKKNTKTTV